MSRGTLWSARISPDHHRSAQISPDQHRSAQISPDQPRSAQISPDQLRSAQISVIPCHRHRRHRHRLHQMSMPPLPFGSIKRIAICFSSGDSAHEQCWKVHLQLPARSRQVLAHVHRRATDSWRSRFSAECFRLAFARDTDDEIDQPKKTVREITSGTAWHRRRRFSAC